MEKQCKWGKLKNPLSYNGKTRYCKLKPKTQRGKRQDKGRESNELHEAKYRKYKNTKKTLKDLRKLAGANI